MGKVPGSGDPTDINGISYRKIGNIVHVYIVLGGATAIKVGTSEKVVAMLPTGCRPGTNFFAAGWCPGDPTNQIDVKFFHDGGIGLKAMKETMYVRSYACFAVNG